MKKLLIATGIATLIMSAAAMAIDTPVYNNTTETQGKSNEIVIMVSNGAAETAPCVQAQLTTFAPELEVATDGKVGVEIYANGQIGDDVTSTEMIVGGQLDANNTSTAPLVNYVPELGIFDIPFLFEDEAEADYILDNTEVGEYLNGKLAEMGIINVAWNENGFRELTNSKRAVATVDDVAGLKIRTMENEFHQELWNSLGATATPMSTTELYTALEQGTVDGEENPVPNYYAYQFQEVQKYVSFTNHIYSPFLMNFSAMLWDGYGEDVQEAIKAAAAAYAAEERKLNRDAVDVCLQSCIDDYGMEVTYIEDDAKQEFLDKTAHIKDMIAKKTGDEIMGILEAAQEEYQAQK